MFSSPLPKHEKNDRRQGLDQRSTQCRRITSVRVPHRTYQERGQITIFGSPLDQLNGKGVMLLFLGLFRMFPESLARVSPLFPCGVNLWCLVTLRCESAMQQLALLRQVYRLMVQSDSC